MFQTDSTSTVPETASADLSLLKSMSLDDLISKLASDIVSFFISVAIAVVVFYVGKLIIRKLYAFTTGVLIRRKVDQSLSTFILSLVKIVMYFILIVTVIGLLGINTSSFIALFASAGVAVGMALSGTLQNFAGGVLILLLKPYKVGDYIEAQGFSGTVTEIQIFSTIISTPDNKTIIIPNGPLSTGTINNWSSADYRRLEWTVTLSYGDDVATAKSAIADILDRFEEIVKTDIPDHRRQMQQKQAMAGVKETADDNDDTQGDAKETPERPGLFGRIFGGKKQDAAKTGNATATPSLRAANPGGAPTVNLSELADSSINFTARAWVPAASYWPVYFAVNELLYEELPKRGLHFPFPQLDVHLSSGEA